MAAASIRAFRAGKVDANLANATKIIQYGHSTCTALLNAFASLRAGKKGTPTDEQQDLLRAMVVFAMASLDSGVEQMITDTFPELILKHDPTRVAFEDFATKKLSEEGKGTKFLLRILRAPDADEVLITDFIEDRTHDSLQSTNQLLAVAEAFGVNEKPLREKVQALRESFMTRNRIIHELDIDFTAANRNRRSQTRDAMIKETNDVLAVADDFLKAVDKVLASY